MSILPLAAISRATPAAVALSGRSMTATTSVSPNALERVELSAHAGTRLFDGVSAGRATLLAESLDPISDIRRLDEVLRHGVAPWSLTPEFRTPWRERQPDAGCRSACQILPPALVSPHGRTPSRRFRLPKARGGI